MNHNVPRADRDFTTYMPYHNAQSMFLTPLVPEDILSITNKFKQKTSYGADGVSTKLLTKTIDKIINPITHIINSGGSKGGGGGQGGPDPPPLSGKYNVLVNYIRICLARYKM